MNLIERDMLTRCLGSIYEQMLMGDTDAALASIEGVTWLVRYMAAGKSSQRATLENELRAVRAVFQICRGEVGLETGVSGLDPYLEVKRTAVLYEACQHGLELLRRCGSSAAGAVPAAGGSPILFSRQGRARIRRDHLCGRAASIN